MIKSAKLFRYSLPFKKPMRFGSNWLDKRDGLLIQLADQQGRIGWGDIAPLPGFSRETVGDALNELRGRLPELLGLPLNTVNPSNLLNDSTADFRPKSGENRRYTLSSSVRFGLQMAVLGLTNQLTEPDDKRKVTINGLITNLDSSAVDKALKQADHGYRSIKIKVGRQPFSQELNLIEKIAGSVPAQCVLRLDCNRTWEFEQAVAFCEALKGGPIEYIEEPLRDFHLLPELASMKLLPIAIDESCKYLEDFTWLLSAPIEAAVLKPTLLNGVSSTLLLSQFARGTGIKVVISSSFESGLGINFLAALARNISPDIPHGLDTVNVFESDLLLSDSTEPDGSILPRPQSDLQIDQSYLTEVTGV